MTFILRSQAFCFFIHITIVCHEISQFSVCLQQVVLCEGICITCDASLSFKPTKNVVCCILNDKASVVVGEDSLQWTYRPRHAKTCLQAHTEANAHISLRIHAV